jgi:putative inorganic carbon (HCO3(-)) transporter
MSELRVAVGAVVAAATLLAVLTLTQAITADYERDFMGLAQRSLEHLEEGPEAAVGEMGDEDRARGPVDEPNRYAQILLMAAPLAAALALIARSRMLAKAAGLAVLLILGAVLVTYSRGAFVTLVGLALLTPWLGLARPHRLAVALAVCVALTPLVAPGYALRIASIAGVADLFGTSAVEADGPTRGRTTEMLAALAAYTEHPILGVGPGQYMPYHSVHYQALPEVSIRELAIPRRAHNLFLEVAAESGTVGLAVFLFIPLLLLRDLEGTRRRLLASHPDLARVAATFMLSLLAYLGTGMFLHLSYERYYWFLVGLTAAAAGALNSAAIAREYAVRESSVADDARWVTRARYLTVGGS